MQSSVSQVLVLTPLPIAPNVGTPRAYNLAFTASLTWDSSSQVIYPRAQF